MKDRFLEIYKSSITRDGGLELLAWLNSTDFFTAPASTRYHGAYSGGLVEHSVNVFERLQNLVADEYIRPGSDFMLNRTITDETIAICGLLHDICKANFYTVEMRNRKNAEGKWEQYPFYVVDDQLPYGHGEKSVYIISGFMKLSRDEAMAIRWHMGGFDDAVKGGSYALSTAYEKHPLALLTHIADMQATYIDEVRET